MEITLSAQLFYQVQIRYKRLDSASRQSVICIDPLSFTFLQDPGVGVLPQPSCSSDLVLYDLSFYPKVPEYDGTTPSGMVF